MINCPAQIIPPLQEALYEDIQWAQKNEDTEELRNSFKFDHLILLSRCFELDDTGSLAVQGAKKSKREKYRGFYRFEEEEYLKVKIFGVC